MRRSALVLALSVGVTGCGLKTPPVAPELVEPMPPTNVRATPAPTGVRLVWKRPTRYTGGGPMRDIARFDVERVANGGADWIVVGSLVMEDRYRLRQPRTVEWIDLGVFGHNAVARRLYRGAGFVEVGITHDRFRVDGVSIDDIHMVLALQPLRDSLG